MDSFKSYGITRTWSKIESNLHPLS